MSNFDAARKAVAEGDLDYAVDVLEAIAGPERERERHDLTLMRMRLNDLAKREMFGLETRSNIDASRAQIAQGLLTFCKRLMVILSREELPASGPSPILGRFRLPEENSLEKIWGARSTLKRLAWLGRGLEVGRGVCRICTPAGRGTGFIIAPGLLVTNHHVIPDIEVVTAEETRVQFNFEESMSGEMLPIQNYKLDPAVFATSKYDMLDCTVVGIKNNDGTPLDTWGFLQLEIRRKAELGEHVTIIQHPEGGVKQIALTANQVVNIFGSRVQYTTDTMPGSSGSPVFDDGWKVIAIHHSGGELQRNRRGDRIFANEGIAIADIAAAPEFRDYMK